MLLHKKCNFFLYLFSVKIRLEIMLHKVLDRKETFLTIKTKFFKVSKNGIFPKGLTLAFGQKIYFFSLFVFGQKGPEMRLNGALDRKQTFFKKNFKVSKMAFFQRG